MKAIMPWNFDQPIVEQVVRVPIRVTKNTVRQMFRQANWGWFESTEEDDNNFIRTTHAPPMIVFNFDEHDFLIGFHASGCEHDGKSYVTLKGA